MGLGSNLSHFQFTPITALVILAASIAGSVHCVGMCGGLMLAATGTKLRSQIAYHFSRLLGYLSVGAFSGYLGNQLFYGWTWKPFQVFFSSVFLLLLLVIALSYFFSWKGIEKLKLSKFASQFSQFGMNLGFKFGKTDGSMIRAALVGFFTVFLPCGWLYSFVLLAVATHSFFYGGLTLTVFWLGTIPALMGSRIILQGLMAKIGVTGTRAISLIMILVSFLSVFEHWKHISLKEVGSSKKSNESCHGDE